MALVDSGIHGSFFASGALDPSNWGDYGLGGSWQQPKPGETFDGYMMRMQRLDSGYAAKLQEKLAGNPDFRNKFTAQFAQDPAQQKAQAEQEANAAREQQVRDQLDHFAQWANRPVDQLVKDPDVQRLMQSAQTTTANNDRLRGISGGLSNANTEKAAMDAERAEMRKKWMRRHGQGFGL